MQDTKSWNPGISQQIWKVWSTQLWDETLLPDLWSVEIIGQQKTQYNEAPDQKEDIILK